MSKKIFIVEDEPLILEDLKISIEQLGYIVVGDADNAIHALQFIKGNSIDLILLDINIMGDIDGIELGKMIRKEFQIPFIYITSYFDANTTTRAQETNPLAYIVKPFKDADISVNLTFAFNKINKPEITNTTDLPKDLHLFVKKNNDLKRLNPNNVSWIKGEDNYTSIYCDNGDHFLISKTLKIIAESLIPYGFIRIHKSYLINLNKISTINGNTIYLGSQSLPIGKSYRKSVINALTIF